MKQGIKQRIDQIKNGEVPQGYKKTKIGIVPNEWEVENFDDVFTIVSNNVLSRNDMNDVEGYFLNIHYGDILTIYNENLNCSEEKIPFINKDVEMKNYQLLNDGYVVFSDTAEDYTVGKAVELLNVGDKKVVSGLHTIPCKPNKKFASKWFGYFCNSFIYHNQLLSLATGAKVTGISKSSIRTTLLLNPPLNEQQKIADILSTQDKVIELKEKLLKEKEKQKKYLMQILLTGRKRLKGFNGEWKKVKLKEYLMEISERNKGLKINNVLSVNNKLGFVKQEIQFGKTVASKDLSNYKIIKNNFIAYNPSRINVGSIAIYQGEVQGIVSPMYVVFKTNEMLDSNYFMFFVQSYEFFEKMKSLLSGSVRDSLNFSDLCNMQILLPSLEEQKAISEILTTADKELKLLQEELEEEKRKKKALMQLLLTGIVRVKN